MSGPAAAGREGLTLDLRRFGELTPWELYEILALRVSVFVVEQHCPYMELDGQDQAALHLCLRDEGGRLLAYLRLLDRDEAHPCVRIGRVIALRRREGHGSLLLSAGIRAARERLGAGAIELEAQTYALPFYARQGFRPVSEEFLEDGIPHVRMRLEPGAEDAGTPRGA